jgi:hypothetical protein
MNEKPMTNIISIIGEKKDMNKATLCGFVAKRGIVSGCTGGFDVIVGGGAVAIRIIINYYFFIIIQLFTLKSNQIPLGLFECNGT